MTLLSMSTALKTPVLCPNDADNDIAMKMECAETLKIFLQYPTPTGRQPCKMVAIPPKRATS